MQEKFFPGNKSNGTLGKDEGGLRWLLLHVPVVFLSRKDISYRTIIILHQEPITGLRPHEVEPNTNYRMWSLVSRQNDSLVQRDSTNNSVNCKGAFRDTTGNSRCSLCFPFLVFTRLFVFFVSYEF